MAKGTRGRGRYTPYPLPLPSVDHQSEEPNQKKDWEDATCSVCMEYPHNAVLLLCSSYDKGCRPYMCGTSCRYSNCLDQYQKACEHVTLTHQTQQKSESVNLACPLCRGQVKGWTVVEQAREFLDSKKRGCMHDDCPFVGNYKATRKHVRAEHPASRPREVDPLLEQKWRRLEREQERGDVISTITSSVPGAVVFGDYVIEGNQYGFDSEDEDEFDANEDFGVGFDGNLMNVLLLLQAFGPAGNRATGQPNAVSNHVSNEGSDCSSEDEQENGTLLIDRLRRQGGIVLQGRQGNRGQ